LISQRPLQPLRKDADFQLAVFRILFLIVGTGYLKLGALSGTFHLPPLAFAIYIFSFTTYALVMLVSNFFWRYVIWRRYLSVIVDTLYVTYGIIYSGGVTSPLFLIYIWLILAQALRRDRALLYTAQASSLIQYLFVVYLDHVQGREIFHSTFVVLTLVLLPVNMEVFYRIMLRSKQAADQASNAKSRFLANMSHELRTPLNAIIGYSEILAENAATRNDSKDEEDLGRIRDSGYYLLDLINEILDISKIEAGKMEIHPERFNLKPFVDEVILAVKPLMQINNNEFVIDCNACSKAVYTDKKKLRQIILNLVSNASKFTSNGTISLTTHFVTENDQELLRLAVTDTGRGIEKERLQHLFEPFAYAESTDDNKLGSTGLGLAISKRFCEILGGRIDANSTPGAGSEFIVYLPTELQPAQ